MIRYDATRGGRPSGRFTIPISDVEYVAMTLRIAMQKIREAGGFPLKPHRRTGGMTAACHAEYVLLDLADRLGIDFGTRQAGHLDLTDPEDLPEIDPEHC